MSDKIPSEVEIEECGILRLSLLVVHVDFNG